MIYNIAALKRKVIARYPFFGSIAAGVDYQETKAVDTMENDGEHLFYNPRYLSGLSDSDQIFTLTHELCHIAFEHTKRGQGKSPVIWERAADAVINQMLKRDGMNIPAGGIDYPEALHYDVEQFYEILLKEKMEIELINGQLEGGENPEGGEGEGVPMSGDDDTAEDENDDGGDSQEQLLEGEESDKEDEEQDDEYALVEKKESKAGNAINQDDRIVEAIGSHAPLIDWRLILLDTMNYDLDWSYRNAVLEDGIVRPVLEELPVPETEIVLDTSWSVDEELLRIFLRECKNILSFSKLKVGCFDTVFYGFHDIKNEKDIDNMPFQGGGGTDFNVAADAFTLRVDNRIIFTDGQAPVPDKFLNAVWVVYGDEEIKPRGGVVIYIKPEQLKNL